MAIINTAQTPTTTAEKQMAVATEIKNISTTLFSINISNFTRIYNLIWKNRTGLTPQEVCDALGTDAGALFTLAGSLQAVINGAKSDSLTLAPLKSVTINSDGTVTIGS